MNEFCEERKNETLPKRRVQYVVRKKMKRLIIGDFIKCKIGSGVHGGIA